MSVRSRAEQAAESAYIEYVTSAAESFEHTLAALAVQEGAVFVSEQALEAAFGLTIVAERVEGGVVIGLAQGSPPPDGMVAGETPAQVLLPDETPAGGGEHIEEEEDAVDEDTSEARAERYIERTQGRPPAVGTARIPHKRPWDDPEDLKYQDAGAEQPEKEPGPLAQNDGSVRITQA